MTKHKYNKYSIPQLNHHLLYGRHSRALAQALPAPNKRWNSSSHKPAFTIIEVVLVLAIAGLIFLMVFIALPALQRSQRDAQRKQHLSSMLDGYERCKANNRGRCYRYVSRADLDTYDLMLVANGYINTDEIRDPSTGEPYIPTQPDSVSYDWSRLEIGRVVVNTGAYCEDGGNMVDYPAGARSYGSFAFLTRLEGGGTVCVSNENK